MRQTPKSLKCHFKKMASSEVDLNNIVIIIFHDPLYNLVRLPWAFQKLKEKMILLDWICGHPNLEEAVWVWPRSFANVVVAWARARGLSRHLGRARHDRRVWFQRFQLIWIWIWLERRMWVEHMMAIQTSNLSVTTMILSVTMMLGEVMVHEGAGI